MWFGATKLWNQMRNETFKSTCPGSERTTMTSLTCSAFLPTFSSFLDTAHFWLFFSGHFSRHLWFQSGPISTTWARLGVGSSWRIHVSACMYSFASLASRAAQHVDQVWTTANGLVLIGSPPMMEPRCLWAITVLGLTCLILSCSCGPCLASSPKLASNRFLLSVWLLQLSALSTLIVGTRMIGIKSWMSSKISKRKHKRESAVPCKFSQKGALQMANTSSNLKKAPSQVWSLSSH